ncbi:MAG: hypothetical protein IT162_11315 [Bryobacterales bacterium]|nr:hypothetical protein [Bryobacterales bacterium]
MHGNTVLEAKTVAPELRELASLEGICVSVYLSGHRGGAGSRPLRVRLNAMLAEAGRMLEQRGLGAADRDQLLAPLIARAGETDLDAGHKDALVMFRTPGRLVEFWMPGEVNDAVLVEGRPFLRPLLRLQEMLRPFLLLALSRKNTRLLLCRGAGVEALELPEGTAPGLRDFEGFDAPERTLGQAGAGVSFGTSTFHDKQHHYLHDFCRALDRQLHPVFEKHGLPLVLAGTTAEVAAYRAANRWALTVAGAVEGSPDDGVTDAQLAERAMELLPAWRGEGEARAVEQFARVGAGRRATELGEVVKAAHAGRVQHLFLSGEARQEGDVDRLLDRVRLSGEPPSAPDDLPNAAAVFTLQHGGSVWMPVDPVDGAGTAAMLRY